MITVKVWDDEDSFDVYISSSDHAEVLPNDVAGDAKCVCAATSFMMTTLFIACMPGEQVREDHHSGPVTVRVRPKDLASAQFALFGLALLQDHYGAHIRLVITSKRLVNRSWLNLSSRRHAH